MGDAGGGNRVLQSDASMGRAALVVGAAVAADAGVFVLLARWQRYLEVAGKAGVSTRRQYRRAVCNFFADVYGADDWTGPRDPLEISEDDAVEYIHLFTPERGPMRGQILRALRSFYGFLDDREVIERSPFRHLKPGRPKYGRAPSLGRSDLERLLDAAEQVDPRARWAIQLQYATGCRVGSLVALTPADVRGGKIVLRVLKGSAPELTLPQIGPAAEAIAELLKLGDYTPPRGTRRPTLVGVGYERYRQWVKEAGERAGVACWTHLLRHTRATRLVEANTDPRTMMEVFGWEDPRMIKRYAALSDENLAAAMSHA